MDSEREKIKKALKTFIRKDRDALYKTNAYETTINHRVALYLESYFKGFSVDCEYARDIEDVKRNDSSKQIRPDIIIHERGKASNFIIFELKKHGKESKKARSDIEKLKNCNHLAYKLKVFVGILSKKIDIVWIDQNNQEESESI